jgi:hypothetical protein
MKSVSLINCEVLTVENGEETTVGYINVGSVPRVGEYIWFSEPKRGETSWIVVDVAHWVGHGNYPGQEYHRVCLFVEPTKKKQ